MNSPNGCYGWLHANRGFIVRDDTDATFRLIYCTKFAVLRFEHHGLLSRYAQMVSDGVIDAAGIVVLEKLLPENYDSARLLGRKTTVMVEIETVDEALLERVFGMKTVMVSLAYYRNQKVVETVLQYIRKKLLGCTGLPPEINISWKERPSCISDWNYNYGRHTEEFKEWLEVMWALSKVLPIKELRLKILGMARPLKSRQALKELL